MPQASGKRFGRQSETGQIVVEYVLLLLIAVSIAVILTRSLTSSDPDDPGFVLEAWERVLREIGADNTL